MSTEEPPLTASAMSPLSKPLHQLTEDDISQLTREDCRRYLKQKGMRRPSWNKSQAIQQVIMLKALLEPMPDSDDGCRKLYITSRQQQTPTTRVQKGTSADTEISLSAEESVPGHRNDTDKSDFLGDDDSAPPGIGGVTEEAIGKMTIFYSGKVNVYDDVPADKARALLQLASSLLQCPQEDSISRIGGVTEEEKGQMTIFYSCKVNVYDDVPADKARALLQLASSPLQFPQEDPFDGSMLQSPSINVGTYFPAMISPILQKGEAEGSASRKASVQRYLEKRKDRFKSKRKAGAPACATFDVYVNHQIGNHSLHEQLSRSATCSPPPVRPPNTPNRFSLI